MSNGGSNARPQGGNGSKDVKDQRASSSSSSCSSDSCLQGREETSSVGPPLSTPTSSGPAEDSAWTLDADPHQSRRGRYDTDTDLDVKPDAKADQGSAGETGRHLNVEHTLQINMGVWFEEPGNAKLRDLGRHDVQLKRDADTGGMSLVFNSVSNAQATQFVVEVGKWSMLEGTERVKLVNSSGCVYNLQATPIDTKTLVDALRTWSVNGSPPRSSDDPVRQWKHGQEADVGEEIREEQGAEENVIQAASGEEEDESTEEYDSEQDVDEGTPGPSPPKIPRVDLVSGFDYSTDEFDSDEGGDTCPVCDDAYNDRADLLQHMASAHQSDDNDLCCAVCGEACADEYELIAHVAEHIY